MKIGYIDRPVNNSLYTMDGRTSRVFKEFSDILISLDIMPYSPINTIFVIIKVEYEEKFNLFDDSRHRPGNRNSILNNRVKEIQVMK